MYNRTGYSPGRWNHFTKFQRDKTRTGLQGIMKNPGFIVSTDLPGNHGIRLQWIMRKPGFNEKSICDPSGKREGIFQNRKKGSRGAVPAKNRCRNLSGH